MEEESTRAFDHINGLYRTIKFTMDIIEDGKPPFLGMLLKRKGTHRQIPTRLFITPSSYERECVSSRFATRIDYTMHFIEEKRHLKEL